MAVTAQSVVRRATDILQDQTSVRWTAAELVRWLNDGQREIALYRPDVFETYGPITLQAGTRQTLPANGAKLIDLTHNVSGTKLAIRQVPRRQLDEQNIGWHALPESSSIKHYTYDPRTPRTFFVFPPAIAGTQIYGSYAANPTDIAEPAGGTDYTAVVGNVAVPDTLAGALLDYVLYRGYSKNNDYAGDPARAAAHYSAFANAVGIDIKSTVTVAPTVSRPGELAGGAA